MASLVSVREIVAKYVSGQFSQDEFAAAFAEESYDYDLSSDLSFVVLCGQIQMILADECSGLLKPIEAKYRLGEAVLFDCPSNLVVEIAYYPIYQALWSSSNSFAEMQYFASPADTESSVVFGSPIQSQLGHQTSTAPLPLR